MATTRFDGRQAPRGDGRRSAAEGRPTLAATLAEVVRERVRDEGLDPQADPRAVRGIADRVVQAHDQRSLTGAVEPLEDAPALVDELVARVSGYGPLQRYLDDPGLPRGIRIGEATAASRQAELD